MIGIFVVEMEMGAASLQKKFGRFINVARQFLCLGLVGFIQESTLLH